MKHREQRASVPSGVNVFGYARVSTEQQSVEGHSLADQQNRIEGYAKSQGLTVTETFVEGGVSGSKRLSHRPKGSHLLARLEPGDHVIATKLDRMFRSASDALNVAERFREQGVHLHLLDLGGEITDGVGRLVFNILAAVAEMERERIGERVRSVKSHLREAGYFTGGKMARGYRKTADRKLVADPNWNRCLAQMKKWREEEIPYRAIADRAGEEFGISLDYSTAFRILNGKRRLDAVRAA